MSDSHGELLAEIWNSLKPYIDKKERADAAVSFLRAAEDFVDLEAARDDLMGTDTYLDTALRDTLGEYEEEIDDEEY